MSEDCPSPKRQKLSDIPIEKENQGNQDSMESQESQESQTSQLDECEEQSKYYLALCEERKEEATDSENGKRTKNVLSWDNYFMALSYLSAKRSPDPHNKVGACIVNSENHIVGMGYNAMPLGMDDQLPTPSCSEGWINTKYPYVCSAEMNAILSSNAVNLKGCTLHCTVFPFHEDIKLIIQAGIAKIVYYEKYKNADSMEISKLLLSKAGVAESFKRWDKDDIKITGDSSCFSVDISTLHPMDEDKVLSKEDYFMAVALISSGRSKDPQRMVGACIVNEDQQIVGVGYNRFPRGCDDDDPDLPWRGGDWNDPKRNKLSYVCHAEANAILHKNCISLKNCTIYSTYYPCNGCMKLILQSGIKKIMYLDGRKKYKNKLYIRAAKILVEEAEKKEELEKKGETQEENEQREGKEKRKRKRKCEEFKSSTIIKLSIPERNTKFKGQFTHGINK